jgi:hypothetical protein
MDVWELKSTRLKSEGFSVNIMRALMHELDASISVSDSQTNIIGPKELLLLL